MEVKVLASRWAWAVLLLARLPSSLRGGQDARVPSSLRSRLLARIPSSLHGGLLALVPSNQTVAHTPPSMVKFWHSSYNTTICNINVLAICFKRTSLAINVCALSQTRRFFYHDIYVPCHETMPSFMFFGWIFDLLGFKNQDSQCFRTTRSL